MKAPFNSTPRTLAPAGTYLARVVRIIYIGTILTTYMGEEKEIPKLQITWELPTETHIFKEGEKARPFVVSKEYSHSMGKKSNLRPDTEAMIGTALTDEEAYAFDHDELLGMSCQITVIHDAKESGVWEKITAVSPLLKGIVCPPPVNDLKVLSFEKWDEEYFSKLPNFIKNKIVSSKEYKKMKGTAVEKEIDSSEIPF